MAYFIDDVYTSVIQAVQQFVPSGIPVVSGESYGIDLNDPSGKSPSIAVTLEDITDNPIELGSNGVTIVMSCTVNAASRLQRDALKSILYTNIANTEIPIYSSGILTQYSHVVPGMQIRDMPNYTSGNTAFYWVCVAFFTLELLQ